MRIDLQKINAIIDNTPILVDIHKDFLQTIIKARKELILEVALTKNKNITLQCLMHHCVTQTKKTWAWRECKGF